MKLGFHRQRAGDADALALAARELVRVAARIGAVEADLLERLGDVLGLAERAHQPVHRGASPTISDTRSRGLSEAKGSWKIICTASCQALAVLGRHRGDILAAPPHDARGLRQDAGDDAAEGALAAARFAHQAHHLALGDVEIDVGNGLHDGLAHAGAEGIGDPAGEIDPLDEALGDAAQGEERSVHGRTLPIMPSQVTSSRGP